MHESVYLTLDTSRMETANAQQDEEADTRIIAKEEQDTDRQNVATVRKKFKTRPN